MNIVDILTGTPVWVWVVLFFILHTGMDAVKPSTVSIWQLSVMPLIFIAWSIYSIYYRCAGCPQYWLMWIIPGMIGVVVGYKIAQTVSFRVLSNNFLHLEGSIQPLLLSLGFFAIKYSLGVIYAVNPALYKEFALMNMDVIASGLIAGISLGRFTYFYHQVKNS